VPITVEKNPTTERLHALGVQEWPVWEKEVSRFPWQYSEQEICYILEGEAEVSPSQGEAVRFGKGDLVVFPAGLTCTWNIIKTIKKHYHFGE
jgi:uncharacterized cupin superfamily protein